MQICFFFRHKVKARICQVTKKKRWFQEWNTIPVRHLYDFVSKVF